VEALDREMDRFMREEHPHQVVSDVDTATGELICKVEVYKNPPLEWSLYIGDALQNVRAALDYLASELTILNLGTAADLNHTAYPVFSDSKTFNELVARRVGGVTPAQRALLEQTQPYMRRDSNQWDQLAVVNALSKIDKHRTVHLAWIGLRSIDFPRGIVELVEPAYFGPLEHGAELARFRGLGHPGQGEVKVDINFAFGVTLTEPTVGAPLPVRTVLGAVHDHAANILDAFAPMFLGTRSTWIVHPDRAQAGSH
jgi:hypothetical protein